jgi:L-threonylcarbamoyladenylate synthase
MMLGSTVHGQTALGPTVLGPAMSSLPEQLDGTDPQAVARAADHLAQGRPVAFATETVYGLGARADDAAAVAQVFALKGRPSDHPLIVHTVDAASARAWAAHWPAAAERLAAAFWPGPLTMVVPRRMGWGEAAAGGQDTIGLRVPAHPVARALLHAAAERGVPGVAAPSANRFGRVSPTLAAHVVDEFQGRVQADELLVLDGGACLAGIESTLVDLSRGRAVLLRPGVLAREELASVLGEPVADLDADAPRASGTLASHYAPQAQIVLLPLPELEAALAGAPTFDASSAASPTRAPLTRAVYSRSLTDARLRALRPHDARDAWLLQPMPADPAAVAFELFRRLREWDASGIAAVWVEAPPATPAWEGVIDRLSRAAAPRG